MKIICRKCGENHLTVNCNKCKDSKKEIAIINNNNVQYNKYKYRNYQNNKTYKIKITQLPNNITNDELLELLYEWGDITSINIKNYADTSIAYVIFKYEEQVDYFIKALDKTQFEYLMINIIKI